MKKIRGPLTGGLRITKVDTTDQLNRKEEHRRAVVPTGTDYAREIKQREADMYKRVRCRLFKERSIKLSVNRC